MENGRVILERHVLRDQRKRLGLSQEALAELCFSHRLCVSIASIKRAETGKPVLYRTARQLAEIYSVDMAELISETAQQEEPQPPTADSADCQDPDSDYRNVITLSIWPEVQPGPRLRECIAELGEQFGGILDAPSGDTPASRPVTIVFGIPRAYTSDARRCLQCATEIRNLLVRWEGQQGCSLIVRQTTWPVQRDHSEPLQSRFRPVPSVRSVWVDHELTHLLGEHFQFGPPISGFAPFEGSIPPDQADTGVMVGRDMEVRQLKTVLESMQVYEEGHLAYIRGGAGVGKSRLVSELVEMSREAGIDSHVTAVLDFGVGEEAEPLRQLLSSLLRLPHDKPSADSELVARIGQLGLGDDTLMHFRALLGLPQAPGDAQVYAAMKHDTRLPRQIRALQSLLLAESLRQPLVLVFEDVHWAETALLGFLGQLLRELGEAPVLWVLTSRLEQDPLETHLRGYITELPMTVLDLAPLRSAAASLVAQQFDHLDPDHRNQCIARAQGNPLFLTQLLLSGGSARVPGSLKTLVQTKLDQLPALDRKALRVAATLGQRFRLSVLRYVMATPDYHPAQLMGHYLIRQVEPDLYTFIHDLILQGVYELTAPSEQQALHQAIAHYYWQQDTALCALHLHRARAPEAPERFLRAIAEKLSAYRYEGARELIRQCRDIHYAPVDRYQLELLAAETHTRMGQIQDARDCYGHAVEAAVGDDQRVHAMIGLARVLNVLDDMQSEEQLLEQARVLAEAAGDASSLAEIYYLKGNLCFPVGDFQQCRQFHQKALERAREVGSIKTEALAFSGLGDAFYAEGRMNAALETFQKCIKLCEQHGYADIEASNLFMAATTRLYTLDTSTALTEAVASAELGNRVGNLRAEIVSRLTAAWLYISLCDPDNAEYQVAAGLHLARTMGALRFEAFLLESLARVRVLQGNPRDGRKQAERAWAIVEQQQVQRFIGPWVLGTLATLTADSTERHRTLELGTRLLASGCVGHNHFRFNTAAAEACLVHGDSKRATDFADALERFTAPYPCAWATHHIDLIRHYSDWLTHQTDNTRERLRLHQTRGTTAGVGGVMTRLATTDS